MQKLKDAIQAMQRQKVLVLGDMVADIYLQGLISRISREAPVLVLEQAEERIVAGGAANVVNNLATLGGCAYAAGVVGNDTAADGLRTILQGNGAVAEGLLTDASRPTIAKTRIIAGGRATVSQQIVRIDKESKEALSSELEAELWQYIEAVLPELGGVVLSDYGGITVSPLLRERLLRICRERGVITIVDSRYAVNDFVGVDYVKQNDAEIAAAAGRELNSEDDITEAGFELLKRLNAKGVLVTRGEKGMMLFEKNGAVHNIPVTDKSEVFDVSGAGDTCVAAVILALAGGVSPAVAAELSNIAAGIAVRKQGTATVSAAELSQVVQKYEEGNISC